MDVYQPREDSELLKEVVIEHAVGRVLDMGTGSGIQAKTAAEKAEVTEVIAVDCNPVAVKELKGEKIFAKQSDMFSNLAEEKFDTIICNPPYLPDEKSDRDPALYGGPNGFEWSLEFLKEAKAHLNKDGRILFLFSSLTNKDRIDAELKKLGYCFSEEKVLAMFFERLYVYKVWLC